MLLYKQMEDLEAKRLRRASRKKYRMTTSAYRRKITPFDDFGGDYDPPNLRQTFKRNSPYSKRQMMNKLRRVLARSPKKPRKKVVAIVGQTTKNNFHL